MAKNTVVVSILSDAKKFGQGFDDASSKAGRFTSKLGTAAKAAAVAVGVVAAVVGGKAVAAASSLEQAMGGLSAVFKDNADQMTAYAKKASGAVGLAQSDYAQLATVLGSQLKNMGVAASEVGTKTNDLIGLGADLAAQFGGSTSDAVSALSSLLRGERDPIEQYGVSINDARIQAKLAEMGLAHLTGEALAQAKTQATLALLYEQTADAQGAFARESATLAGQQERVKATQQNIIAQIGGALLPAVTAVTGAYGTLLDKLQNSAAFNAFTTGLENVSTKVGGFITGLIDGTTKIDIGELFTRLLDAAVSGIQRTANWLASGGAQAMLNGLLAGRQALFDGALKVFPAILDALVTSVPMIVGGLGTVVTQLVTFLASAAPIILDGAVQLFTGLLNALVTIIPPLLTTLTGLLPQLVAAILGMLGPILDAAVSLFTALIDALPIILPELLGTIIGLLPTIIMTILMLIPKLLTAAVQLFTALITALPLILPNLLIKIVGMLPEIVRSVLSMLPALIQAGVGLFTALVQAVPMIVTKLVPALIALGPKMVSTIQQMAPQLVAAGGDLINGLVRGLVSGAGKVGSALLNIAKNALNSFKSFLGIRSPSRVFAGFGENIGQGLAIGIDKSRSIAAKAVDALSATVTSSFDGSAELDVNAATTPDATASGGLVQRVYQITVHAVAPTAEVGRAVMDAIKSYENTVAVPVREVIA